jgi:hypothetical protein
LLLCRIKAGASKLKQSTIPSSLLVKKAKTTASPIVAPTTPATGGDAGGSSSSPPHVEAKVIVIPSPLEGAENPVVTDGAGTDSRVEASADDTLVMSKAASVGEGSQPAAKPSGKEVDSSIPGSSMLQKKMLTKADVLRARGDAIDAMSKREDSYFTKLQQGNDYLRDNVAVSRFLTLFLFLLITAIP